VKEVAKEVVIDNLKVTGGKDAKEEEASEYSYYEESHAENSDGEGYESGHNSSMQKNKKGQEVFKVESNNNGKG
jgi:hypothetical protein